MDKRRKPAIREPRPHLTMEEMRSYLTSLKEIESVTGIRYIKLHVTAKMIIGIREAGRGIRILRQDLWEMIITFIISQQKTIPAIRALVEALSEKYGTRYELSSGYYYAFPTPEELNHASLDDLLALKLGYRAKYIKRTCEDICSGKIGLTFEEKAFYDILMALRDEYNFEYGKDKIVDDISVNEKCSSLARKIKEIIDAKSSFADWLNNQNVRDQLKFDIKVCLIKNGYPPQYSPEVFRKVMEQVENIEEHSSISGM